MDGTRLTVTDFTAHLDKMAQPEELAFPHDGHGHAYTGPQIEIFNQYAPIIGNRIWNKERAARRAQKENELLIDKSLLGLFLDNFTVNGMTRKGVYAYYEQVSELPLIERISAGDAIWAHASKLFIRSLWGKVSTTVCGANRSRIFYTVEIPYMMAVIPELLRKMQKAKDIDLVNEFPTSVIRNHFSMNDFEKAYKYFSVTEQRKVLRLAQDDKSTDVYADYLDTLEMFHLDKYLRGIAGNHPLNSGNAQERDLWKRTQMDIFANQTLKNIDQTLGVRPKQIFVVRRMPNGSTPAP